MTATNARDELRARFGLDYQVNALEDFNEWVGLGGKDVLEVGGSLPEELVRGHYGARTWTAIDNTTAYDQFVSTRVKPNPLTSDVAIERARWTPDTWIAHDGRIHDLPETLHGHFDVVVSIAAFEHLDNLPGALDRMRKALKPGGKLCALVGPIWSGYRGHHVYEHNFVGRPDEAKRLVALLSPWSHLVFARPEMFAHLRPVLGAEFAEVAVASIYESNRINRLSAEEYLRHFDNHDFDVERLDPWITDADVDRSLLPAARSRHPTFKRMEWDGFSCVLTRKADER